VRLFYLLPQLILISIIASLPIGFIIESVPRPIYAFADIPGCFSDNFSGTSLGPGWVWTDPIGGASYSLTANPGNLRLQAPNGNRDMATFNRNAPRLTRNIFGDFLIETKLEVNPVQTYQAAGLLVWFDNSNFLWIARSVGNKLGHHYVRDGNYNDPPEVTGVAATTVYIRIARSGNTFSTYYKLYIDGDWTMTGSIEYPSASYFAHIGPLLINNWQDNPISADFDYVNIDCVPLDNIVFLPFVAKKDLPPVEKTVFTISYLDATPINDPDAHQVEFIAGLQSGSTWHGHSVVGGDPWLTYNTYDGSVIPIDEAPPYRSDNGKFDYAAVYDRFDLCTKIQAGEVDEVWIWESGTGNAWEWVTNGPTWSWIHDANVPNCGRTVTTMNLNYQREIDVAYESFSHRLEGAFMTHYPCDFYTETWPWTGWPAQCTGLVSDTFGYVARPFTGNDDVAVCGDAHHPPNILDAREYIYDDETYVDSICKDWQWDGSGEVSNFNCDEWDCTHKGFHIWWMQNLPGYGNDNLDRDGNTMPNWWESLFW
jgi:regulation of enolase protein 1 (concanavalin A-like superfamily)